MQLNKVLLVSSVFALTSAFTFAQTSVKEDQLKGWHLKDQTTDGFYGISMDKAFEFVKNRKSTTIIVAVIDSGIDTLHEDLKPVLWRNPKEIPGNGIDDDKNGYVDDIYGWNFLGSKDGRNVKEDSYEAARLYHALKKKSMQFSKKHRAILNMVQQKHNNRCCFCVVCIPKQFHQTVY